LRTIVVAADDAPADDLARIHQRFPMVRLVRATGDAFRPALAEADAALSWGLTAADLAAAPRLWWLQTIGAGVDGVLIPELIEREIVVTNASGAHAQNISEHVMAMMLALTRRLPYLMRGQTLHEWRNLTGPHEVDELYGQTLLLVGLGDIGAALAARAAAFGVNVIGVRRRPDLPVPPGVQHVVGVDRLGEVLPLADQVVITLPLTPYTAGLFDATMIARMKPGAYIYNIGRGSIIDANALVEALDSGRLAGAGLDVTDPEPLPAESPLWDMEQVIITAHSSGRSPRRWTRLLAIFEANIEAALAGRPMVNVVDHVAGY
jgi:phosphoglycerate dehydrogenase-like enzyme